MSSLDWGIIVFYLLLMVVLSYALGHRHSSQEDYFLSGRNLPWWAVGLSTMATQSSAISFISIPAFVTFSADGGLTILKLEPAVPIAMVLIITFLVPLFRRLSLISIYQYLEHRFNHSVRLTISALFLLSRGLAAGISTYAVAIVLSVGLNLPVWQMILLIGVVTVLYDAIGGMSAVVYSDVVQMVILLAGIILCLIYSVEDVGGLTNLYTQIVSASPPTETSTSSLPLWAFVSGSLFLYLSYYGTDQSQAQRQLSAASDDHANKSLIFNSLARFPLHLLYIAMGITIGAVYQLTPELCSIVSQSGSHDTLVPFYIIHYMPEGIRALIIAAILAAAMSSLDSTINSLSAVTLEDFILPRHPLTKNQKLWAGRITTALWGGLTIALALYTKHIADTVIEAINKAGSVFYGPILAVFLCGILFRRVSAAGALSGLIFGIGLNLSLWLSGNLHWVLWNLTGFLSTSFIACLLFPLSGKQRQDITPYTFSGSSSAIRSSACNPVYWGLIFYGVIIAGGIWGLEHFNFRF